MMPTLVCKLCPIFDPCIDNNNYSTVYEKALRFCCFTKCSLE